MLNRRTLLTTAALATVPLALPHAALAQGRKDSMVLGMTLEPPGLDPTAGAAAAIAEISPIVLARPQRPPTSSPPMPPGRRPIGFDRG